MKLAVLPLVLSQSRLALSTSPLPCIMPLYFSEEVIWLLTVVDQQVISPFERRFVKACPAVAVLPFQLQYTGVLAAVTVSIALVRLPAVISLAMTL